MTRRKTNRRKSSRLEDKRGDDGLISRESAWSRRESVDAAAVMMRELECVAARPELPKDVGGTAARFPAWKVPDITSSSLCPRRKEGIPVGPSLGGG